MHVMCSFYQIRRRKRRLAVTGARVASSCGSLSAASVVVAGVISFVGILVPHIARRLVGHDHVDSNTALLVIYYIISRWRRTIFALMEVPASTITLLRSILISYLERVTNMMEIKQECFITMHPTRHWTSGLTTFKGKVTTIIGPNGCGNRHICDVM